MEGSQEPVLDAKSKVTNQLVDFQWKLGMAVSSNNCRSLKYPYVAVMLKVADQSGQVKSKSFEMTIPQFQNFYKQFKEIAAVIETRGEFTDTAVRAACQQLVRSSRT